nr:S24 family peptidase [Govania unica]
MLTPTPEVLADQLDLVLVPQIDMSYGLGATFIDEQLVKTNPVPFPRSWLELFSKSEPENMFFALAEGDSMEPTIMDRDIVLVDRTQHTIRGQDRMWAIAMGPLGMIKRVRALPDGTFKIISDNPRVPPEIACESELHVVGRVVGVVRKT